MADAVEAAWQHVQEKTADELVGRERHGLEPVAAVVAIVLTWGASGQGGDTFMRPSSSPASSSPAWSASVDFWPLALGSENRRQE